MVCEPCLMDKTEIITNTNSIVKRTYHQGYLVEEHIQIFKQDYLASEELIYHAPDTILLDYDRVMPYKRNFDYKENRIYIRTIYADGEELNEIVEIN